MISIPPGDDGQEEEDHLINIIINFIVEMLQAESVEIIYKDRQWGRLTSNE